MIPSEQDYLDLSNRMGDAEGRLSNLEVKQATILKHRADQTLKPDLGAALILCVMVITIGVVVCFAIWMLFK